MVKGYRLHVLVAISLAIVLLSGWQGSVRNALADLRFRWLQREAAGEVVVVAIDAPSISAIGVWPWPRRLHAQLLRRIVDAGAGDIAFDIDFSAPSADPASDGEFVQALKAAGGSVVLPSFKQPGVTGDPSSVHVNRPLKPFADQSWSAIVNVEVEPDGRVRRYPVGAKMGSGFLPSMAAVLAGKYDTAAEPFLIDFGIRASSIRTVSYADVLRGDPATLAKLKDRKIIVGATALELGDRVSIPNGSVVSGPVLQALAAESLLQGRSLRWTSEALAIAGTGCVVLLMMLSWRRLSAGRRAIALLVAAPVAEIGAVLLQGAQPVMLDTSLWDVAIVAYLVVIALDEIDFRGLLGRVAESRFQRIAMSLGDGLVCMDRHLIITIWNPGAEVIFGYSAQEMIGRPFDMLDSARREVSGSPIFAVAGSQPQSPWLSPGGFVTEFYGRRKSGEIFPVEACISAWQGTDGQQFGTVLRDISVRKREAERIRYLAEHDPLTGLANRATFQKSLSALVSDMDRTGGEVALLVLGLDGFQRINDMLGHASGDALLQAVAKRLTAETGTEGLAARLGGDEFAIAVPSGEDSGRIGALAQQIMGAFDAPLPVGVRTHRLGISLGMAIYPRDGRNADELLSNGHLAFYRAKGTRRGECVMFESSIRQELETRLGTEAELALALERNEFELFYQPQVRLADGHIIGAEALIRWRHPERGLVPPALFMPIVNTSAISERVASWVLATASLQAARWELLGHPLRIGINLSPSQLRSNDLGAAVYDILDATGVTPSLIELEVTEDILLLDEKRVLDTFREIQALGVRIVFDDFGTGFASLSYLKKFPLDGLKIDRSFVTDLLGDPADAAIVKSTIGLGKELGMSIIAEGIEGRRVADMLVAMGCKEGQGYFFGKPMPAKDLEAKLLAADELEGVA